MNPDRTGSARRAEGSATAASVAQEKAAVLLECWFTWRNIMALIMCMPTSKGNRSILRSDIFLFFVFSMPFFLTLCLFSSLQLEEGAGRE